MSNNHLISFFLFIFISPFVLMNSSDEDICQTESRALCTGLVNPWNITSRIFPHGTSYLPQRVIGKMSTSSSTNTLAARDFDRTQRCACTCICCKWMTVVHQGKRIVSRSRDNWLCLRVNGDDSTTMTKSVDPFLSVLGIRHSSLGMSMCAYIYIYIYTHVSTFFRWIKRVS